MPSNQANASIQQGSATTEQVAGENTLVALFNKRNAAKTEGEKSAVDDQIEDQLNTLYDLLHPDTRQDNLDDIFAQLGMADSDGDF